MTPIVIDTKIKTLNHEALSAALERKSYEFCVNADFTNKDAVIKLTDRMEQYAMEALMRIFKGKLGYKPFQNKIYDEVEKIFDNQDSYNINRAFSSMRRTKYFDGVDPEDKKYQTWFKNRVRYGFMALQRVLREVEYVEVPTQEALDAERSV